MLMPCAAKVKLKAHKMRNELLRLDFQKSFHDSDDLFPLGGRGVTEKVNQCLGLRITAGRTLQ